VAVTKGAGLCVGVSRYDDRGLVPLPDAALGAQEILKAFDAKLVRGMRLLTDPGSNGDLFLALQRVMQEAQGGSLVLYFAGHALRRGSDLLLAVRESEVEGTRGCVPWGDVADMVKRAGIVEGLVLLNLDQPAGAPPLELSAGKATVMGSVRRYDAGAGNRQLRGYADAVLAALKQPALQVEPFLNEGKLDADGLGRCLAARASAVAAHTRFASTASGSLVLRDLSAELEAAKARAAAPPAPVVEAPPQPPEPEPVPEAVIEAPPEPPAPEPVPAIEPVLAPLPVAALASPRPSKMPYVLIAAAILAAVLYALLR
jgi:hypothetical protein